MRSLFLTLATSALLFGASCASEPERDGSNYNQCMRQCKKMKIAHRSYCRETCAERYRRK